VEAFIKTKIHYKTMKTIKILRKKIASKVTRNGKKEKKMMEEES
jgi:hypothetical protein